MFPCSVIASKKQTCPSKYQAKGNGHLLYEEKRWPSDHTKAILAPVLESSPLYVQSVRT